MHGCMEKVTIFDQYLTFLEMMQDRAMAKLLNDTSLNDLE